VKNLYSLSKTVAVFFCLTLANSLYAHPTDSVYVRQQHPHVLTGESTAETVGGLAYARADLDGTGTEEYLVAAYSNTVQDTGPNPLEGWPYGNVIIWKGVQPPFIETKRIDSLSIDGFMSMKIIDVNHDGKDEIWLAGETGKGSKYDIYEWKNNNLVLISPSPSESMFAGIDFPQPTFEDITESAWDEIIIYYKSLHSATVFKFNEMQHRYIPWRWPNAYSVIERPSLSEENLNEKGYLSYSNGSLNVYTDVDRQYQRGAFSHEFKPLIWVYNGDGNGTRRLNGTLKLNGEILTSLSNASGTPRSMHFRRTINNLNDISFEPSSGGQQGRVRVLVEVVECLGLNYKGNSNTESLQQMAALRGASLEGHEDFDLNDDGRIDDSDLELCAAKCRPNDKRCIPPVPLPTIPVEIPTNTPTATPTNTEIPTATPTNTPTPIPTATVAPTSTVGALLKLQLTSMPCVTPNTLRWRVRNPNFVAINARWDLYNTGVSGTIVASPGDTFFETSKAGNTLRLFVGTVLQATKASQGCNLQ
jgi:hypothetical protein